MKKSRQKAGKTITNDSIKLTWNGKDSASLSAQSGVLLSVTHNVYPYPLLAADSLINTAAELSAARPTNNRYYQADNLAALENCLAATSLPPLKLIYIDPPYMSQIQYRSRKKDSVQPVFEDRWQPEDYLNMLYPRLRLMRDLLAEDGSIFVHVDWHVSHYIHLMLDEIFGAENFINEIVWCYSSGGNSRRHLQRKHDLIYWYGKSSNYTFNPQYRPYTSGTLARGLTAVKGDKYKLSAEGALLQDWWTDINKILSPTAYENCKYPTQKPRQLLKRIIAMASSPGDLVADFFAGSGTTAEVCNELGRPWIMCDNSPLALQTTINRLTRNDSPPFAIYSAANAENHLPLAAQPFPDVMLKAQASIVQDTGDKYVWIEVGIEAYQPSPEITAAPAAKNFADLIEFWEIDPDYNEMEFNSYYQIFRPRPPQKGLLPLKIVLPLPRRSTYKIALKVHDILGKSPIQVIKIPMSSINPK